MQEKLINLLKYIGIIGATICSFAYIIVVIVLIQGFRIYYHAIFKSTR